MTGGRSGAENPEVWEDWEEFAVTPRAIHWALFLAALGLPVVLVVLAGLALLLAGLDDDSGARFFLRLAVALGGLWVIDLVGLILVGAYRSLGDDAVRTPDQELDSADEELGELGE